MFRINLADLQRTGSLRVEREIPPDDPIWEGLDLRFDGPVRVDAKVARTSAGQVLVEGQLQAALAHECRRCLEPVTRGIEQRFEILWSTPDPRSPDPAPGEEVRVLEPGAAEVDLGEAIREEILLAAPPFVVCADDCRGLCPRCGANLNEERCECVTDEPDPRWDVLRALNQS